MIINNIVAASFVEREPGYNGWHAFYSLATSTSLSSSKSSCASILTTGGSSYAFPLKVPSKLYQITTSSSIIEKTSYITWVPPMSSFSIGCSINGTWIGYGPSILGGYFKCSDIVSMWRSTSMGTPPSCLLQ